MPLLDHFRPPLSSQRFWNTFHSAWAATLARHFNRFLLPQDYFAVPNVQFGPRVEIDVATMDENAPVDESPITTAIEVAPPPTIVCPISFADTVAVDIFNQEGGPELVAAIELVSPSNKDRPDHRQAFVAKMTTYLQQGMGLIVVDIVTARKINLHNAWVEQFDVDNASIEGTERQSLYAHAYRTVQRQEEPEIEMWLRPLELGEELPTLPLYLRGDVFIQVSLEETYKETCEDQRIRVP